MQLSIVTFLCGVDLLLNRFPTQSTLRRRLSVAVCNAAMSQSASGILSSFQDSSGFCMRA